MFDTGPLFKENYDCIGKYDIVVDQGGTDSGKTFAIIQLACWICSFFKAPPEDPIFSVLSESIPNSKKGPYRIFESLYNTNKYLRSKIAHWDRAGRVVTFKSGWILEFLGATDEQNAKQGKRQFLFVNEANGLPWLIFWQMAKRTRQCVFIDYNPTAPFWAHDNLIDKPNPEQNDLYARVRLIISDHRHNPFLSQKDHDRTENIKDPELWKVYARGLTGKMLGLIYPDWEEIADQDFPWDKPKFGAIDYGYTNDPTAILNMRMVGHKLGVKKKLFLHEGAYETGLPNAMVKSVFKKDFGFTSSTPIYSEIDHTALREVRLLGLLMIPAIKGDKALGIHFMKKEFDVFYTRSSKNIKEEVRRYMWGTDPNSGLPTNEPIDKDDHLMDAARYGGRTHVMRTR